MVFARSFGVSWLVFGFALLFAGRAWASDVAAAEALFNDARALMDSGDTERACAKFKESQRLDPSAGTALNLARCYEKLGRTASAWGEYQVAERMATTQGRTGIADEARRKAEELGQTLGTLNVEVTEPVEGLEVQLGETTLAAAALGSKIPTDPGDYTLRVTAPGHEPYETQVTITNGQETKVTVPALAAASTSEPGDATPEEPAADAPSTQPPVKETDNTLAYVIGGGGVVLLGGGVVLGFLASGENDEARSLCSDRTSDCPPDSMTAADSADTLATAGTVVGAIGAVGIGVGAILLLTGGPEEEPPFHGLTVSFDRGYAGLGFSGVLP